MTHETKLTLIDRALAMLANGKLAPFDSGRDYRAYLVTIDGQEFILSEFDNSSCDDKSYGLQSV